MVFSSVLFLFLFLPAVLVIYHLLFLPVSFGHKSAPFWLRTSNFFLLCSSLLFYFWGETWLIWILLSTILIDYFCGLLISEAFHKGYVEQLDEHAPRTKIQKAGLIISISSNLAFLGFFKYFNFGVDSLNAVLPEAWKLTDVMKVTLPLGISFYTFQSMSYTIDVYRGHVKATRNLIDFSSFVTLFPQLVAGPIVRYCDVAQQMTHRTVNVHLFASGVVRFVLGLGKKVLIANTVAQASSKIFALPAHELTTPLAWIGIVCYTIQIYFDFSGYSDMAIGLGRMFGFEFIENFNFPYIARSIQEFWRRWHISLSTWFRDYLYIPLGGSRKSEGRTYFNLITVFFLCGLWHGASWTFVTWGLYHGLFLVMERTGLGRLLKRMPHVVQHIYTLLVVMTGWLIFASESLARFMLFFKALLGFAPSHMPLFTQEYFSADIRAAILYGTLFSMPIFPWIQRKAADIASIKGAAIAVDVLKVAGLALIILLSATSLSAGTLNPFIYFRF
jgi:alginate O-acetyltransferase complex protein AlgI